jgi:hypothetical protein
VYELIGRDGRGVRAPGGRDGDRGWLYFFSPGATLILGDYPEEWRALSWEELDSLRAKAQVLGSDSVVRVPDSTPRFESSFEVRA